MNKCVKCKRIVTINKFRPLYFTALSDKFYSLCILTTRSHFMHSLTKNQCSSIRICCSLFHLMLNTCFSKKRQQSRSRSSVIPSLWMFAYLVCFITLKSHDFWKRPSLHVFQCLHLFSWTQRNAFCDAKKFQLFNILQNVTYQLGMVPWCQDCIN